MESNSYDALDSYMKGITINENGLGAEQEKKLSRIIKHSNNPKSKDKAINDLVVGNLGLVIKCAREILGSNSSLNIMDLIAEGNYWLLYAARRFSYTKDCRFSTYAYPIIRWHIWRAVGANRLIHVPVNVLEYRKRFRELQTEHKGKVTKEIIMKEFDVAAGRAEDIDGALRLLSVTSLSNPIGEEGDSTTFGDMIKDDTAPDPAVETDRHMLKEYLNKMSDACLSAREKQILYLMFSENGETTLQEVASEIKISRERIRQIGARAMRKLRARFFTEWDSKHHEDRIDRGQVYKEVVGVDDYVHTHQMRQERDAAFNRKITEMDIKKRQKILNDLAT